MNYFTKPKNKLNIRMVSKNQHGFSLIEFMVASAISMIVLLAAGSTYFTTMRLKQESLAKISYQQDMREAVNLIRRDLRQAGDFGCWAAPDSSVTQGLFGKDFTNNAYIASTLPTAPNVINGITYATGTTPLIIIYGDNTVQTSAACGTATGADHVTAVAYVVGRTSLDDHDNLYRIVYDPSIAAAYKWSTPQMIADNVTSMTNQFQYVDTATTPCPKTKDDPAVTMTLTKLDNLDTSRTVLPILAKTTLQTSGMPQFVADTMIQQGNVCLAINLG